MKHLRRFGIATAACLVSSASMSALVSAGAYGAVVGQAAKTAPTAKTGWASLPVGAATGFPFGYVKDEGVKISLPPPNDKDVDQSRVAKAPRVGPFHIDITAGEKAWPGACSLTSAAQLRSLFPAITGLKGKPVGAKGENLGSGGNTPHDVQCKFNLKTTFDPQGYAQTPSWVEVDIEEVDAGSPSSYAQARQQQAASAKKYPAQYADYPNLNNGVKCFYDGNEIQCLKGDFSYWVLGQKVTGGADSTTDQAVWVDQVEIPVAEMIGAEVSTTP